MPQDDLSAQRFGEAWNNLAVVRAAMQEDGMVGTSECGEIGPVIFYAPYEVARTQIIPWCYEHIGEGRYFVRDLLGSLRLTTPHIMAAGFAREPDVILFRLMWSEYVRTEADLPALCA